MLRIGDFARLAGVTVRALRHYEERGLLQPALVDSANGYRFYRTEQLATLDKVLALRDLGFSLRETRELLDGGAAEVEARLGAQRDRLAAEVRRQTARLRRLSALQRAVAGHPRAPEMSVRVRALPAVRALTRRARIASLGQPVTELFEAAEALAADHRIDCSPFLLFHQPFRLDVEVCVPVRASCKLPGVREVPGAPLAGSLTYSGDYGKTSELGRRMKAWLQESGLRAAGPLREVYHRFGADQRGYRLPARRLAVSPEQFVTELQLPVQEEP